MSEQQTSPRLQVLATVHSHSTKHRLLQDGTTQGTVTCKVSFEHSVETMRQLAELEGQLVVLTVQQGQLVLDLIDEASARSQAVQD